VPPRPMPQIQPQQPLQPRHNVEIGSATPLSHAEDLHTRNITQDRSAGGTNTTTVAVVPVPTLRLYSNQVINAPVAAGPRHLSFNALMSGRPNQLEDIAAWQSPSATSSKSDRLEFILQGLFRTVASPSMEEQDENDGGRIAARQRLRQCIQFAKLEQNRLIPEATKLASLPDLIAQQQAHARLSLLSKSEAYAQLQNELGVGPKQRTRSWSFTRLFQDLGRRLFRRKQSSDSANVSKPQIPALAIQVPAFESAVKPIHEAQESRSVGEIASSPDSKHPREGSTDTQFTEQLRALLPFYAIENVDGHIPWSRLPPPPQALLRVGGRHGGVYALTERYLYPLKSNSDVSLPVIPLPPYLFSRSANPVASLATLRNAFVMAAATEWLEDQGQPSAVGYLPPAASQHSRPLAASEDGEFIAFMTGIATISVVKIGTVQQGSSSRRISELVCTFTPPFPTESPQSLGELYCWTSQSLPADSLYASTMGERTSSEWAQKYPLRAGPYVTALSFANVRDANVLFALCHDGNLFAVDVNTVVRTGSKQLSEGVSVHEEAVALANVYVRGWQLNEHAIVHAKAAEGSMPSNPVRPTIYSSLSICNPTAGSVSKFPSLLLLGGLKLRPALSIVSLGPMNPPSTSTSDADGSRPKILSDAEFVLSTWQLSCSEAPASPSHSSSQSIVASLQLIVCEQMNMNPSHLLEKESKERATASSYLRLAEHITNHIPSLSALTLPETAVDNGRVLSSADDSEKSMSSAPDRPPQSSVWKLIQSSLGLGSPAPIADAGEGQADRIVAKWRQLTGAALHHSSAHSKEALSNSFSAQHSLSAEDAWWSHEAVVSWEWRLENRERSRKEKPMVCPGWNQYATIVSGSKPGSDNEVVHDEPLLRHRRQNLPSAPQTATSHPPLSSVLRTGTLPIARLLTDGARDCETESQRMILTAEAQEWWKAQEARRRQIGRTDRAGNNELMKTILEGGVSSDASTMLVDQMWDVASTVFEGEEPEESPLSSPMAAAELNVRGTIISYGSNKILYRDPHTVFATSSSTSIRSGQPKLNPSWLQQIHHRRLVESETPCSIDAIVPHHQVHLDWIIHGPSLRVVMVDNHGNVLLADVNRATGKQMRLNTLIPSSSMWRADNANAAPGSIPATVHITVQAVWVNPTALLLCNSAGIVALYGVNALEQSSTDISAQALRCCLTLPVPIAEAALYDKEQADLCKPPLIMVNHEATPGSCHSPQYEILLTTSISEPVVCEYSKRHELASVSSSGPSQPASQFGVVELAISPLGMYNCGRSLVLKSMQPNWSLGYSDLAQAVTVAVSAQYLANPNFVPRFTFQSLNKGIQILSTGRLLTLRSVPGVRLVRDCVAQGDMMEALRLCEMYNLSPAIANVQRLRLCARALLAQVSKVLRSSGSQLGEGEIYALQAKLERLTQVAESIGNGLCEASMATPAKCLISTTRFIAVCINTIICMVIDFVASTGVSLTILHLLRRWCDIALALNGTVLRRIASQRTNLLNNIRRMRACCLGYEHLLRIWSQRLETLEQILNELSKSSFSAVDRMEFVQAISPNFACRPLDTTCQQIAEICTNPTRGRLLSVILKSHRSELGMDLLKILQVMPASGLAPDELMELLPFPASHMAGTIINSLTTGPQTNNAGSLALLSSNMFKGDNTGSPSAEADCQDGEMHTDFDCVLNETLYALRRECQRRNRLVDVWALSLLEDTVRRINTISTNLLMFCGAGTLAAASGGSALTAFDRNCATSAANVTTIHTNVLRAPPQSPMMSSTGSPVRLNVHVFKEIMKVVLPNPPSSHQLNDLESTSLRLITRWRYIPPMYVLLVWIAKRILDIDAATGNLKLARQLGELSDRKLNELEFDHLDVHTLHPSTRNAICAFKEVLSSAKELQTALVSLESPFAKTPLASLPLAHYVAMPPAKRLATIIYECRRNDLAQVFLEVVGSRAHLGGSPMAQSHPIDRDLLFSVARRICELEGGFTLVNQLLDRPFTHPHFMLTSRLALELALHCVYAATHERALDPEMYLPVAKAANRIASALKTKSASPSLSEVQNRLARDSEPWYSVANLETAIDLSQRAAELDSLISAYAAMISIDPRITLADLVAMLDVDTKQDVHSSETMCKLIAPISQRATTTFLNRCLKTQTLEDTEEAGMRFYYEVFGPFEVLRAKIFPNSLSQAVLARMLLTDLLLSSHPATDSDPHAVAGLTNIAKSSLRLLTSGQLGVVLTKAEAEILVIHAIITLIATAQRIVDRNMLRSQYFLHILPLQSGEPSPLGKFSTSSVASLWQGLSCFLQSIRQLISAGLNPEVPPRELCKLDSPFPSFVHWNGHALGGLPDVVAPKEVMQIAPQLDQLNYTRWIAECLAHNVNAFAASRALSLDQGAKRQGAVEEAGSGNTSHEMEGESSETEELDEEERIDPQAPGSRKSFVGLMTSVAQRAGAKVKAAGAKLREMGRNVRTASSKIVKQVQQNLDQDVDEEEGSMNIANSAGVRTHAGAPKAVRDYVYPAVVPQVQVPAPDFLFKLQSRRGAWENDPILLQLTQFNEAGGELDTSDRGEDSEGSDVDDSLRLNDTESEIRLSRVSRRGLTDFSGNAIGEVLNKEIVQATNTAGLIRRARLSGVFGYISRLVTRDFASRYAEYADYTSESSMIDDVDESILGIGPDCAVLYLYACAYLCLGESKVAFVLIWELSQRRAGGKLAFALATLMAAFATSPNSHAHNSLLTIILQRCPAGELGRIIESPASALGVQHNLHPLDQQMHDTPAILHPADEQRLLECAAVMGGLLADLAHSEPAKMSEETGVPVTQMLLPRLYAQLFSLSAPYLAQIYVFPAAMKSFSGMTSGFEPGSPTRDSNISWITDVVSNMMHLRMNGSAPNLVESLRDQLRQVMTSSKLQTARNIKTSPAQSPLHGLSQDEEESNVYAIALAFFVMSLLNGDPCSYWSVTDLDSTATIMTELTLTPPDLIFCKIKDEIPSLVAQFQSKTSECLAAIKDQACRGYLGVSSGDLAFALASMYFMRLSDLETAKAKLATLHQLVQRRPADAMTSMGPTPIATTTTPLQPQPSATSKPVAQQTNEAGTMTTADHVAESTTTSPQRSVPSLSSSSSSGSGTQESQSVEQHSDTPPLRLQPVQAWVTKDQPDSEQDEELSKEQFVRSPQYRHSLILKSICRPPQHADEKLDYDQDLRNLSDHYAALAESTRCHRVILLTTATLAQEYELNAAVLLVQRGLWLLFSAVWAELLNLNETSASEGVEQKALELGLPSLVRMNPDCDADLARGAMEAELERVNFAIARASTWEGWIQACIQGFTSVKLRPTIDTGITSALTMDEKLRTIPSPNKHPWPESIWAHLFPLIPGDCYGLLRKVLNIIVGSQSSGTTERASCAELVQNAGLAKKHLVILDIIELSCLGLDYHVLRAWHPDTVLKEILRACTRDSRSVGMAQLPFLAKAIPRLATIAAKTPCFIGKRGSANDLHPLQTCVLDQASQRAYTAALSSSAVVRKLCVHMLSEVLTAYAVQVSADLQQLLTASASSLLQSSRKCPSLLSQQDAAAPTLGSHGNLVEQLVQRASYVNICQALQAYSASLLHTKWEEMRSMLPEGVGSSDDWALFQPPSFGPEQRFETVLAFAQGSDMDLIILQIMMNNAWISTAVQNPERSVAGCILTLAVCKLASLAFMHSLVAWCYVGAEATQVPDLLSIQLTQAAQEEFAQYFPYTYEYYRQTMQDLEVSPASASASNTFGVKDYARCLLQLSATTCASLMRLIAWYSASEAEVGQVANRICSPLRLWPRFESGQQHESETVRSQHLVAIGVVELLHNSAYRRLSPVITRQNIISFLANSLAQVRLRRSVLRPQSECSKVSDAIKQLVASESDFVFTPSLFSALIQELAALDHVMSKQQVSAAVYLSQVLAKLPRPRVVVTDTVNAALQMATFASDVLTKGIHSFVMRELEYPELADWDTIVRYCPDVTSLPSMLEYLHFHDATELPTPEGRSSTFAALQVKKALKGLLGSEQLANLLEDYQKFVTMDQPTSTIIGEAILCEHLTSNANEVNAASHQAFTSISGAIMVGVLEQVLTKRLKFLGLQLMGEQDEQSQRAQVSAPLYASLLAEVVELKEANSSPDTMISFVLRRGTDFATQMASSATDSSHNPELYCLLGYDLITIAWNMICMSSRWTPPQIRSSLLVSCLTDWVTAAVGFANANWNRTLVTSVNHSFSNPFKVLEMNYIAPRFPEELTNHFVRSALQSLAAERQNLSKMLGANQFRHLKTAAHVARNLCSSFLSLMSFAMSYPHLFAPCLEMLCYNLHQVSLDLRGLPNDALFSCTTRGPNLTSSDRLLLESVMVDDGLITAEISPTVSQLSPQWPKLAIPPDLLPSTLCRYLLATGDVSIWCGPTPTTSQDANLAQLVKLLAHEESDTTRSSIITAIAQREPPVSRDAALVERVLGQLLNAPTMSSIRLLLQRMISARRQYAISSVPNIQGKPFVTECLQRLYEKTLMNMIYSAVREVRQEPANALTLSINEFWSETLQVEAIVLGVTMSSFSLRSLSLLPLPSLPVLRAMIPPILASRLEAIRTNPVLKDIDMALGHYVLLYTVSSLVLAGRVNEALAAWQCARRIVTNRPITTSETLCKSESAKMEARKEMELYIIQATGHYRSLFDECQDQQVKGSLEKLALLLQNATERIANERAEAAKLGYVM